MKSDISGEELNSVVQMRFTKNKIPQRYEFLIFTDLLYRKQNPGERKAQKYRLCLFYVQLPGLQI